MSEDLFTWFWLLSVGGVQNRLFNTNRIPALIIDIKNIFVANWISAKIKVRILWTYELLWNLNFNNFITIQIWCLTVTLFFVTFEKKLLYGDYHPFLVSWLKDHPPLNYCLVKFKYFRPMFNIKEKRYFIYFWCNYTCMHMKIINSGNILL